MTPRNRVPIILGSVAAVLLVAVIVALTILLTRGSGTPASSTQTDAAAPAPAPSASTPAADPAHPAATRIVLAADGFSIVDAEGEQTFRHGWGDEGAPAIAALTDAFGAPPTEGFQNGDAQHYAYTLYDWEGFRFADVSLSAGNKPREKVPDPTWVSYTANTVAGVEVGAEFGLAIGLTADEVEALHPDATTAGPPAAYRFGTDRSTFYQDGVRSYTVTATADAAGEVAEIAYRFDTGGQ